MNSHFTFPHNEFNRLLRLQQIDATLEAIDKKKQEQKIPDCPILFCGDFNDQQDTVHERIMEYGFQSAFHQIHGHEVRVSHCNHNHGEVGVDFIFTANAAKIFEPIECHLLPKDLSDQTLLERPRFGHNWEEIDMNLEEKRQQELVEYWSMVSDHRPLVAKFNVHY